MWKLLLPLVFLACNSTETQVEAPKTKKASLNLKEACAKSQYYVVTETPSKWHATVSWQGKDSLTYTDQVLVQLSSKGFALPCGYGVEGDPNPVFTLIWD